MPSRIQPRSFAAAILVACAALAADAARPVMPASAQSAPPDSMRSVLHGAYTAEQAVQGETVFRETCGNCHPTSQFTGAAFQRTWHGRPVFAFFDQLRMMMPMDNPGGLPDAQYAAVIAYILKLNAYPTGSTPLPATDSGLRQIRFEQRGSN